MPNEKQELNLWFTACAHVHSDLQHGRRSFAEAIEQSEKGGADGGPPFDWDAMLFFGDFTGTHHAPTDAKAGPVLEQLDAGQKHSRNDIYAIAGISNGIKN